VKGPATALAALALALATSGSVAAGPTSIAEASQAKRPAWTKNCSAVNKKYKHGVGRRRARDKTSGTPVTTFRRSTALYLIAMKWNKGLDRDKDGIACEKL
jgi:hypothetical protein